MTVVHLATGAGLLHVSESGRTRALDFEGQEVVAVDARRDAVAAAVSGGGVWLASDGGWRNLGLGKAIVWTVAVADDHEVFAGVEPASLWRLGDERPRDLVGLSSVAGHEEWHSPWGPADLSTIVVDGDRLIVGVEIGGIAVSHDCGATWEARNRGLFDDVHVVIASNQSLYATTGMGCFVSHDEGRQWTWASDGIEHGYTLGLTRTDDVILASGASGPPLLWGAGGPEAAIYRARTRDPLRWELVFEEFEGAVERNCLKACGDLVVAGTTTGELLVSVDGGRSFALNRDDLAPVHAVAISE